jgi:hypothetical protein
MSKILRISESDYRIKVQDGGNITLDVGLDANLNNRGTVIITGNLEVVGNTTTVESSNTSIKDNIIILNSGETGAGVVTLGSTSGLQIDRGSEDAAEFIWDELTDKFIFQTNSGSSTALSGITVANIATDPLTNLEFDMQNGSGVLRIANSPGYSALVTAALDGGDDDVIPNVTWVSDYVSSGAIVVGQADIDRIYKGHDDPVVIDTQIIAKTSSLEFYINGTDPNDLRAVITSSGLGVDNIRLFGSTISNATLGLDLILTALSKYVEINSVLTLIDHSSVEAVSSGKTKLYSLSNLTSLHQTPGRTGLFFANNVNADELVAKNRALLFSMIF